MIYLIQQRGAVRGASRLTPNKSLVGKMRPAKENCATLFHPPIERKVNMYEFHVRNIHTDEKKILFGYTANDAFRRAGIVNTELWNWEIEFSEYVD